MIKYANSSYSKKLSFSGNSVKELGSYFLWYYKASDHPLIRFKIICTHLSPFKESASIFIYVSQEHFSKFEVRRTNNLGDWVVSDQLRTIFIELLGALFNSLLKLRSSLQIYVFCRQEFLVLLSRFSIFSH